MFTQSSTFPTLSETSKDVFSKPTTSSAILFVAPIHALKKVTKLMCKNLNKSLTNYLVTQLTHEYRAIVAVSH